MMKFFMLVTKNGTIEMFETIPGTFCATTKTIGQPTGATFKNVLINVISSCPSKTAGIITTNNVERGIVWRTAFRKNHRH